MTGPGSAAVRAVADAVLYEGYLLYPYRASSRKNQSRWQFGVLGPRDAARSGLGEDSEISAQCLIDAGAGASIRLAVRFLHLQRREAQDPAGTPIGELTVGARSWITWDEAVEGEIALGPLPMTNVTLPLDVPGGAEVEEIGDAEGNPAGRLMRTRRGLTGELTLVTEADGAHMRLTVRIRNIGQPAADTRDAIARSFIVAHVIAELEGAQFISLLEPEPDAAAAVARCVQHRCFPVLAGAPGDRGTLLISPIILYDYPEIAEESRGALFDSTEIDEILTLRVMTMTDEEKAQARATDPRAAQIIDRCDAMTPESMRELHGALRDPHLGAPRLIPEVPDGIDWWDPLADNAVAPDSDAVSVNGIRISKGSRVRLHPSRRADAQDLFFAGQLARVTSVHEDVDGHAHVGVVIEDDPAADLHEWYGRYLYFAPDEIEPVASPEE
ncbi:hypothetical protein GFY24_13230 [Nocardia sp. SYP-A9097]|uniref:hypothetical protein n=1 Tax=Nocardia sp. SYP-A9097 TaxID=2663237 RepID=UPI00129A8636|nr:hypothetical protein [Nocardia sp. SYP-A9097]MRH88396.1 hypothetical protein [Nocardia sp. SYP-A9097]